MSKYLKGSGTENRVGGRDFKRGRVGWVKGWMPDKRRGAGIPSRTYAFVITIFQFQVSNKTTSKPHSIEQYH